MAARMPEVGDSHVVKEHILVNNPLLASTQPGSLSTTTISSIKLLQIAVKPLPRLCHD